MPTILVTGANGLLATHIIIELLENGYHVKGLLRNRGKFQYPGHPNLELIESDITDFPSVKNALAECGSVIHVAALTAQNFLRYDVYEKVNVQASEKLVKLAIDAKIKRFVYVSSANAFGYGSKENPGDETTSMKAPFTSSLYARSKQEAQMRVLSYRDQMEVVVINPTFMLGAYDGKPSSGQIIFMGYHKPVIFYPPGGKNFVHVADVAKGTVLALENGTAGESYLMANENLSYREFFRQLAVVTERNPMLIPIPGFILLAAGYIGDLLRFIGYPVSFSSANMRSLCVHNYYNNEKAGQQLGMTFRPVKQAIAEAIDWFRSKGMLS
jgi:nucleoside-diphosphate-sugar epimerase